MQQRHEEQTQWFQQRHMQDQQRVPEKRPPPKRDSTELIEIRESPPLQIMLPGFVTACWSQESKKRPSGRQSPAIRWAFFLCNDGGEDNLCCFRGAGHCR